MLLKKCNTKCAAQNKQPKTYIKKGTAQSVQHIMCSNQYSAQKVKHYILNNKVIPK